MIAFERPVRFQDVDAAGLLFFPEYASYAHEAMEHFFEPLDGGYVGLIQSRRIGLPAVRVETEFFAPVRYGDRLSIQTSVAKLGNRSLTFRYRFVRQDGVVAAELLHTVVTTDLEAVKSCEMPADVRGIAEAHLERGAQG
jgi:4-hydroxybenzoyl-CoA thioesterase